MFEAMKMVERGDATAADIDTGMKLGAGYREFEGPPIRVSFLRCEGNLPPLTVGSLVTFQHIFPSYGPA